jgi:predicted CXXCH cytochrome family protein
VHVTHFWVDRQAQDSVLEDLGTLDGGRSDLRIYGLYQVRFQILNSSADDVVVHPELRYGAKGSTTLALVPSNRPELDVPFYVADDEGRGNRIRIEPIAASDLVLAGSGDPDATAVAGEFVAGPNPAQALPLPAHSYTEVVFAVRVTGDTAFDSSWRLSLALGMSLASAVDAVVQLGPAPKASPSSTGTSGTLQAPPISKYRLAQPALAPTITAGTNVSPHQSSTLTEDNCARCHRSHTAKGFALVPTAFSPISTLCLQCHNGTGASSNTQAQYTAVAALPNNAATGSYYSHPATTASSHVLISRASEDPIQPAPEFAGVLNRHSECSDCHQPHNSSSALGIQTAAGWTAGGAIAGTSGVAVVNGAANTSPTYALVNKTTYEYQLCFKCHSGYTTLPAQNALHPAWWALDKAIEFNPANLSFHPVEAKGTNANFIRTGTVGVMDRNLAGTSNFKVWTFTSNSTIRCENCHGSSMQAPVPANAGSQADNHASVNRGILLKPYRDRLLKPANQNYSEGEFALCFMCHANEPFANTDSNLKNTSNFRFHGLHVIGIPDKGTYGTGDIDSDGAGQGNALCAECHYRMHGSTYVGNAGAAPNKGLVNFAPNVQPNPANGVLSITLRSGNTAGTCTLRCHGQTHNAYSY